MNPPSPTPTERARKCITTSLRHLAAHGQKPIADALGVSEATISRHISEGHFERAIQVLSECGLKVVPQEMRIFDPKDIEALLHGHKRWTEHLQSVEQLWEGDN